MTVVLALSLFNFACKNSTTTTNDREYGDVVSTELSSDAKPVVVKDSKAKSSMHNGEPVVCGLLNESNLRILFGNDKLKVQRTRIKEFKKSLTCLHTCMLNKDRFTLHYRKINKENGFSSLKWYSSKGYTYGGNKIVTSIESDILYGKRVAWSKDGQLLAWVNDGVHILLIKDAPTQFTLSEMLSFAKSI